MIRLSVALTTLAVLAPLAARAQPLIITRDGSRAIRPGPPANFTGEVRVEMLSQPLDPSQRQCRLGHLRGWCPHGVALASARADS